MPVQVRLQEVSASARSLEDKARPCEVYQPPHSPSVDPFTSIKAAIKATGQDGRRSDQPPCLPNKPCFSSACPAALAPLCFLRSEQRRSVRSQELQTAEEASLISRATASTLRGPTGGFRTSWLFEQFSFKSVFRVIL